MTSDTFHQIVLPWIGALALFVAVLAVVGLVAVRDGRRQRAGRADVPRAGART